MGVLGVLIAVGFVAVPAGQAAGKKVAHAKLADTAKNANRVNKLKASKTPKAGQLLALDASGKFPIGVIPISQLPKGPSYTAGFGLALAGTTFHANPQVLQLRVAQMCPVGEAIREIKLDGTITCQVITAAGGGDITAVSTIAGSGLTGGAATGDVTLGTDFDTIQKRVAACPASQFVTAVAVSGVPACAVVVQSVTTGAGLTKTGTASAPVLTPDTAVLQTRIATACPAGQAIRSVDAAGAPTCQATGTGTITGVTAGTGLSGGGTSGNVTLSVAAPINISSANSPVGRFAYTGTHGTGVLGQTTDGVGVNGAASGPDGTGVVGENSAQNGNAVEAEAFGDGGIALYAGAFGSGGQAGYFQGNVAIFGGGLDVHGTLTKTAGSFKIDDPLDPANRYLQHSFVESPDMKNVYDGVTVTDDRGYATVKLPAYFQALNRSFRYQLTTIRSFSRAIVWREVTRNRFVIRSEDPRVKVSWQITGIRRDAYAKKHPVVVSTAKAKADRGHYLNPDAFGKPARMGIGYRPPPKP